MTKPKPCKKCGKPFVMHIPGGYLCGCPWPIQMETLKGGAKGSGERECTTRNGRAGSCLPEKPAQPPNKLLETYIFCFGNEPCSRDRIFERRKIMQALIYLLQMKGVNYGYDDFELKVGGIHSLKLSFDLNKLGLLP